MPVCVHTHTLIIISHIYLSFPGDVSPIDVISHIPVFCENKKIPYCYVPSRRQLGSAGGTKRPTSVVLVEKDKDYEELYQQCYSDVDALPLPI